MDVGRREQEDNSSSSSACAACEADDEDALRCSVCFEHYYADGGISCTGDQHFVCNNDLPEYMKENVFPYMAKLREARGAIQCPMPGCTSVYDTLQVYYAMSKMDRARYTTIIRDVVMPESPMVKKLHLFLIDLMTLKCPTCNNPVDPFPDACSAVMCLFCGKHYCNYCFKGFDAGRTEDHRAAAHEHAAQHNTDKKPESRDAFLSSEQIVVGQRARLTELLLRCIRLAMKSDDLGIDNAHQVALALLLAKRELSDLGIDARDIWSTARHQVEMSAHAAADQAAMAAAANEAAMILSDDGEGAASPTHTRRGGSTTRSATRTSGGKGAAGGGHDTKAGNPHAGGNKKLRSEAPPDAALSTTLTAASQVPQIVIKHGGLQIANAILTNNPYAINQVIQTFRGPVLDVDYIEQTHGHPIATLAILADQPRVAVELVRAGANPLLTNGDGRSVLYIAAESGCFEVIQTIVESRSDLNLNAPCTNEMQKYYPMHVAARYNHRSIVKYLFDHGATLDPEEGEHGYTPLTLALVLGHQLVAAELIRLGCDLRKHSKNGRTPMFVAAEKGLTEIINLVMLHRKFDINESVVNPSRLRLLHVAAFHQKAQTVARLIELGADVNQKDDDGGYCPLAMAIIGNSVASAIELVEAGADVRCVSKIGNRAPLYFAVEKGMADIVRKIICQNGVSVNDPTATEASGSRPLHLALLHSQSHLVPMLLRLGADVTLKDSDKQCTALLLACILEDEWSVQRLLAGGSDPRETTTEGRSSVYIAAEKGSVGLLSLLIEKGGVGVNEPCTIEDHRGTPLHIAAMFNHPHAVIELLEWGANPEQLDEQGRRAIDVATETDSVFAVTVLEEWSRRPRGPTWRAGELHRFEPRP